MLRRNRFCSQGHRGAEVPQAEEADGEPPFEAGSFHRLHLPRHQNRDHEEIARVDVHRLDLDGKPLGAQRPRRPQQAHDRPSGETVERLVGQWLKRRP